MAELADALDLGSSDFGRKGSTPFVRTIFVQGQIGVKVMFKKLGISAFAALIALSTMSITEAASSDTELNTLCHRGGSYYHHSQDREYNDHADGDCYNDGYCGRGRGCW